MIVSYFAVFIYTFASGLVSFAIVIYLMSLMTILVVAISHFIHTKYQLSLIEIWVNQIDYAYHVLQVKNSLLFQAFIASVQLIAFELLHHAILDQVWHGKNTTDRYYKIYFHDFTDLISLCYFLWVLWPRPPLLYFDTINIDTIDIGLTDEERM